MWNFRQFSNHTAIIDEMGRTISYKGLAEENERFGKVLEERSLVFILCSNTLERLVGYIGCLNEKSVPLLLAYNLDRELLESLIGFYQPDYMWVPGDMVQMFTDKTVKYEAFGFALLETGYEKVYPLYNELGLLLTTSGSTGSPKLVRQSYENVLSNAQSIAQYLELDETERLITTLPMKR